jgi:hypothetical protein
MMHSVNSGMMQHLPHWHCLHGAISDGELHDSIEILVPQCCQEVLSMFQRASTVL